MASRVQNSKRGHLGLARQVVDVVLQRGMRCGDHLPEQSISEACGVSRTPIRSAFNMLEACGVLEKRREKGYFLREDAQDVIFAALADLEESEGDLVAMILADRSEKRIGEIQSVSALVRRYSASRSSVLFALKVLSKDGIVSQLPGRAWAFQPMIDSQKSIAESFELRLLLGANVHNVPEFTLDFERAEVLRSQMKEFVSIEEALVSVSRFERLDVDFHNLIAESSGNRFACSALLTHHRLRYVSRRGKTLPAFRMHQSMREHLEILDCLERKQYELAAAHMVVHLRRSGVRRPDAANRGISPLQRGGFK